MTITADFIGKKLYAAVDEIHLEFGIVPSGEIKIDENQTIIFSGPDYIRNGLLVLGSAFDEAAKSSPMQQQKLRDAAALSKKLKFLLDNLGNGALVVTGARLPINETSTYSPISKILWEAGWNLYLWKGRAELRSLDENQAETAYFRLSILERPLTDEIISQTRTANQTQKNVGGRPQKFDWQTAEMVLQRYFEEEGTPGIILGDQARAEEHMKNYFCSKLKGDHPSESLIRQHVKAVVDRLNEVIREGH